MGRVGAIVNAVVHSLRFAVPIIESNQLTTVGVLKV